MAPITEINSSVVEDVNQDVLYLLKFLNTIKFDYVPLSLGGEIERKTLVSYAKQCGLICAAIKTKLEFNLHLDKDDVQRFVTAARFVEALEDIAFFNYKENNERENFY